MLLLSGADEKDRELSALMADNNSAGLALGTCTPAIRLDRIDPLPKTHPWAVWETLRNAARALPPADIMVDVLFCECAHVATCDVVPYLR